MDKNIVLVEDDSAIADIYKTVFEKNGFKLEVFSLGKSAMDRLKNGDANPDIILLDLILPDMNGIEILEKVRKNDKTKGIPVFILTNYTDSELEKMGYSLKTEKHILKADHTPTQILEMVKKRLAKS